MTSEIVPVTNRQLTRASLADVPAVVLDAGEEATKRFLEFFAANIRNKNTRRAYAKAVCQFLRWCDERRLGLDDIEPLMVGAYIEMLTDQLSPATVKQHLAAIRMLFDFLLLGQVIKANPATAVRGPSHVVRKGKAPVLDEDQARQLLDSIDIAHVVGLRDRALIGVMIYSFARIGAATSMRLEDYYANVKRWWIRLHEKGGKFHEMPAHHNLEAYMDQYITAASLSGDGVDPKGPLFRTSRGQSKTLTENPLTRNDALRMIKRRVHDAGFSDKLSCHTFRATGITNYLRNGGTIENPANMAAHSSTRTTQLYDRRSDEISLDEVERITI